MSYADTTELARLLKVDATTYETQLQEVLDAAAGEIDAELGRDEEDPLEDDWELALAAQVNLERAEEHWKQRQISASTPTDPSVSPVTTWERHAHKLAPLKSSWGVA